MRTVLISGASGFIAGHIARKLKNEGFKTVGISRKPGLFPGFDHVYHGTLRQPLERVFNRETVQTFVHCANHSGKNDYEINVEGTKSWAEQAAQEGAKLQIFLSSLSAREESDSSYARAKFALEKWFLAQRQVSLRLGLVVGDGGLFGTLVTLMKKYPALPLPDGGRQRVYLTGVDFLCDVIRDVVMGAVPKRDRKLWSLFQPNPVSLKALLAEIRVQSGSRCILIPVPSGLILAAVCVTECVPFLPLRMSRNNIIGLRQDSEPEFSSDFQEFGYSELTLAELVRVSLPKTQR